MDIPAPGTGAVCGSCPLGYTGDGLKCYGTIVIVLVSQPFPDSTQFVDIDECLNASTCEQICTNTYGSFVCGCLAGYRLVEDTPSHCEGMPLSM